MSMNRLISITASLMLGLAGCSGGADDTTPPPPPPPPPVTVAEAYQFLNQTSFGATEAEAQRVIDMRFEAWIDDQMQKEVSLQLPHLQALPPPQMGMFELQRDRADIFFRNALHGEDQLRQRVAFALSEIMVVSELGALNNQPYSLASYYDMLAENAFGNYRDLIEDVTLHPAMGVYLSMLGNEKPNPTLNIRPDENYARELMQLFSIGLVELNIDGSEKLDQGQPIPTYDQEIIEGFAHVYTGWTYAGATRFQDVFPTPSRQVVPMQHWPDFHDTGPKTLLNGITLPAGQSGEQDLSDALDNIFIHPNVGPFIAIRLIQRLVTSNPSPGYVSRVAAVFNDNGAGVRGDLGAVVKAMLLDDEARPAIPMELDGKVKEPLLRLTQLWRAYDATSQSGRYPLNFAYIVFGQGPLQAPHVFNFFSPFFAPPGEIRNNDLVAPELEIATEYLNTYVTNYMFYQTFALNSTNTSLNEDDVYINFESEMLLAADIDMLIDSVANKLLAGQISDTLRNEIAGMLALIPETETALRAAETIYFIVTSPEYAYQR
ncbi:MAG: DUF1800 domain-containing protein [Gammaproteobacteria bacterium]|nr:DUF1800 domain-containing protein [Gammaproteobacteria bacterium]MDH3576448.1 DUF1800 domain-containing protein [Gammaproteobacteria bacterium]